MWIKLVAALTLPILLLAIVVFIWTIQYRLAGEVLLTLSKSKNQKLIAITVSIALLVIGIYFMSQDTTENPNNLYIGISSMFCGWAAIFWIQNFLPIELREKGMMISGSLVRWSRIDSYQWQDKQSLLLKLKPWLGNWYRTGKIRISPGKRELVEEILNEKLSTAKN